MTERDDVGRDCCGGGRPQMHVNWKHIDGPLMRLPDGQLRWLTWRERFMHWIGRWSLDDIASRPDSFSKLVYYAPHDTWLELRASDTALAQTTDTGEDLQQPET